MITTYSDIRTDVLDKAGLATTAGFITQDMLNNWIQQAERWATSFKNFPCTEGRVSTTWTGTEELTFEGYRSDSFRYLKVGEKRFRKLNFEDYEIFKEEEPDSEEKVYTDFGKLVLINPRADVSGTLTAFGQFEPAPIDVTDEESTTVFSNGNEEGNEAIVEKVLSFIESRKQDDNAAAKHLESAEGILDKMDEAVDERQFRYQTHRSRGGMFKRINVLGGGIDDELIRRDQFPFS